MPPHGRKPKPKLSEVELAKRKVLRTRRQNKVTMHGTLRTNEEVVRLARQMVGIRMKGFPKDSPENVRTIELMTQYNRYTHFALRQLGVTGPARRIVLEKMRNYSILVLAGLILSEVQTIPGALKHLKAGRAETINSIDRALGQKSKKFWDIFRGIEEKTLK